jgi:hypothetical protein
MSERGDAMPNRGRDLGMLRFLGVLVGLPRLFVSSQVILLSMLFANTMGMRGAVV